MKFKKLIEPEPFCILRADYFNIVMESASHWVQFAYDTTPAKLAWYKKNIITREVGFLMTGFKMNWCPQAASENTTIDMFEHTPTQMLFIPGILYHQISTIKSIGCKVMTTSYGTAKIMHAEYRVVPIFCLQVSEFVREISDREISTVESVDAFVGGI